MIDKGFRPDTLLSNTATVMFRHGVLLRLVDSSYR
jgi:hypothetical protein